ncbi:hypothetical protein ERICV_01725 [Paenibacillus larvae subsp. larvae]|uniref:Uncharacterized protein n=1 Tax=Paenibacillus larvae subsp. larvae TaxID=147375 RepID=A0A6C0QPU3_9BACL|nr:hypothetical protein ERICV_01509 [Paenibacillus larvae subsp. larvae]QHZ50880.1 hypothetical protein ERICV_01725 [Paenibacillus larvae subsp. larvae]
MTQIEKSYLAALARRRNLDLILYMEAVSQIEAIIDSPSLRNKTRVNETRNALSALKLIKVILRSLKQELDRRGSLEGETHCTNNRG